MKDNMIFDCNGISLKEGDIVHDKWGYDLIVSKDDKYGWYGKLGAETVLKFRLGEKQLKQLK